MQPQTNPLPDPTPGPQVFHPGQPAPTPAAPNPVPQQQNPAPNNDGSISWTASEFIANQKDTVWYMILAAAAAVIGSLVFLLTRDVISTFMVVVALGVIAFLASKQPRTMSYKLDGFGLQIGSKTHPYEDFKSFSVIEEGAVSFIVLMPMKRFMPTLNMYFDPTDEEKITKLLSDYLPYVEGSLDFVERLMRRIRF